MTEMCTRKGRYCKHAITNSALKETLCSQVGDCAIEEEQYICPYKQGVCNLPGKRMKKKPKKKVFCIDCQHVYSIFDYVGHGRNESVYYCNNPGLSIKEDTWLKPGVERGRIEPKEANKNNDCNLYEEIPPESKEEQKIPCPPGIIRTVPSRGMTLPYKVWKSIKEFVWIGNE